MRYDNLLAAALLAMLSGCPVPPGTVHDPPDSGPTCGNGEREPWEPCDGVDLGGQTCQSQGLASGDLACNALCRFDLSGCSGCGNGQCDVGETVSSCSRDCGVRAVAAGGQSSCALMRSDGSVRCWGYGEDGSLGDGLLTSSHLPVKVAFAGEAALLRASTHHHCIVDSAGGGRCWGTNPFNDRELGYDHISATPEPFDAPWPIDGISLGLPMNCLTSAAGEASCWGYEVGDGSSEEAAAPGRAPSLPGPVRAIGVGLDHGCALLEDGTIWCWGGGGSGQLGNGTNEDSLVPVRVLGIEDAVDVGGGWSFSCAILADRTVQCWGRAEEGQLGDGVETMYSEVPLPVQGLTDVSQISLGNLHACAVRSDGTAWCWGADQDDYLCQLGTEQQAASRVPVPVYGLWLPVTSLSAGLNHTCAGLEDGTVRCWGSNSSGQIGTLPSTRPVCLPSRVEFPE